MDSRTDRSASSTIAMGEFIPGSQLCTDQDTDRMLCECQKQVEMDSFAKRLARREDFVQDVQRCPDACLRRVSIRVRCSVRSTGLCNDEGDAWHQSVDQRRLASH